jgi:hypothetical protein
MWIIPALVLIPLFAVADNRTRKSSNAKLSNASSTEKPTPAARSQAQRDKQAAAKKAIKLTPQQEKAATAFVKKHHDELLELLIHLKEGLPQEYGKAIRDLSRTSERLEALAGRDQTRYNLELKLWQAKSRRQLLTARLQMDRDDALIEQIRATLAEEHRLQLSVFKHERERFAARVKKLDEQIARQEKNEQSSVDRQLATLTKASKDSERKVKATKRKRPAAKNDVNNTKKPT